MIKLHSILFLRVGFRGVLFDCFSLCCLPPKLAMKLIQRHQKYLFSFLCKNIQVSFKVGFASWHVGRISSGNVHSRRWIKMSKWNMTHGFSPFHNESLLKYHCEHEADNVGFYYYVLIRPRPEQILTKTKVTAIKVIQNAAISIWWYLINKLKFWWSRKWNRKCFVLLPPPYIALELNLETLSLIWLWITLICSGPTCVSFVQPLYVCLYHVTQFFPQQGRLRGPAKPRMPTTAPHFFVFMKKTATERWRRATNPGKCRPFGFLRIGIYVLGFVWM